MMDTITVSTHDHPLKDLWQRIPILIRAIVVGFIVFQVGSAAALSVLLIPAPWSLLVMAGVLFVYWMVFSGRWGPKGNASIRREYSRATRLSPEVWKWSVVAGLLIAVTLESIWMITFRFIEFPADDFALGIDYSSLPMWQVWLSLIMVAAVAGITEEMGFRGYMQVPLEKRYGPLAGVIIVAIAFLLFHLNQAWAPYVVVQGFEVALMWGILARVSDSLIPGFISHTIADIFNFSYWWTDVAGTFDYRPIAETGIDRHFIVWSLLLVASVVLFIVAARKTLSARRQM